MSVLKRELILNFHGLGEPPPHVDSEERLYWLRTDMFACLLDKILDRSPDTEPKVSLTFDDGNVSDLLLAVPELIARGLTASFFICAGRIGKNHYLDEAMIGDLLAAGMSVGSHGMHHQNWRGLDSSGLKCEIDDARRKLEEVVQRPVTAVAIPYGSYDRRILTWLAREQWDVIYTCDGGIADAASKLKPRTSLTADMSPCETLRKLAGPQYFHVRLRRALSRTWKHLR